MTDSLSVPSELKHSESPLKNNLNQYLMYKKIHKTFFAEFNCYETQRKSTIVLEFSF